MATLDTILNIQVTGTDKMTQLKNAIDNTSEQLKQFKKEGQQTGESLKQYQAKVVSAETKLKGLRSELNKSKTELIKNAKAAGDSSKSYNSLVKQNAVLSQNLRKLADPLGKNRKEFERLSKQINTNTNQLKQMDAAMGRSQRNVGNYKQAIGSVALAVGAAVAAFRTFNRAISSFADFEFQMKQVGALSQATAGELDMLTESAKELGRTTTFTAGEVAGFQVELAKLGFDPTEIEAMTGSILDLAFAFGNDLTETGEAVAVTLNAFNLEASETERVTDVLAASFANSALDLNKFTTAFSKVAPIAAASGFEIDDVTTLLGALSNSGFEASSAGTALKNILLNLADSNGELAQTLGRSITSVEELGPALAELEANGIDVAEALNLTDKRSAAAFLTLVKGGDDLVDLNKKINDSAGFTKQLAEVMRDSLSGSLAEASSAASGFVIELVEKLEPAITLIIDGISGLFGVMTSLIDVVTSLAIGFGTYKVVVLASAVATKGLTAATINGTVASRAFSAATAFGTRAVKAFNLALKSNPIGLVTGLLATGAAMLFSWGEESEEATEKTEELNKELTEQEKLQKKLSDITSKASQDQANEISKLKTLKKTIGDTNLALKDREKALNEFNKLAGTNIQNLSDEERLVKSLEAGYNNAVNAIKRKIIIQASESRVQELIKRQLELEEKRNDSVERQNELINQNVQIEKDLQNANQERVDAGLRNNDELVEAGDNLINNTRIVKTENEIFRDNLYATNVAVAESTAGSHSLQMQMQDLAISYDNMEIATTNAEDAQLSANATSEAVIGNMNQLNLNNEILNNSRIQTATIDSEIAVLEEQINQEMSKTANMLDKLVIKTTSSTKSKKVEKGAYAELKSEITEYEKALSNQITKKNEEVDSFLNSEEAKRMSVEDRAAKVEEIEAKHEKKITDLNKNLVDSKKKLIKVEEDLEKQYKSIDKELGKVEESEKTRIDSINETLDAEQKRLDIIKKLKENGAELAKEQIQQALKVSKIKLQLALAEAEASGTATQAQIDNINNLKNTIADFERKLNSSDGDTGGEGFMQRALFGTDENGEPFTGEDLVEALNITFDQINMVLDAQNELQQQRLNSQLSVIEGNKKREVDAFLDSTEAQIMSEEERADKVEEIEKKFNDQMLKLKVEQFKKDQKLAKAQALIAGAQAIMNILAGTAVKNVIADAIIKGILIAATVATTAFQIATINAQKPPTAELGGIMNENFFKSGGMVNGPSHAQGGVKFAVGGRVAELEGGEAVINKKSTAMFKPLLSDINVAGGGRKFADGGLVFSSDAVSDQDGFIDAFASAIGEQKVLLVEADVTQSQKTVKTIQSRISF